MFFSEVDVTPDMLERAYERVLSSEVGDGLRDQVSEIYFWRDFLESTHRSEFEALKSKTVALIDYQSAQSMLATNGHLSDQQKQALRTEIETAGAALSIPSNSIIYGQPMSDDAYHAAFVRLGDEKTTLYKTLSAF